MLSLFAADEYAGLGLATVLEIERIPYRRIARLAEHDQPLLVAVGQGLSRDDVATVAGRPSLVLHGGTGFAAALLGAPRPRASDGPARLSLSEPLWPRELVSLARDFDVETLCLPRVPLCRVPDPAQGEPLARLQADDGTVLPAAMHRGACVWSALDLGTAFAHLLSEGYAPGGGSPHPWLRRAAESAYYAVPTAARARLQAAAYRRLDHRLRALGGLASAYPIDATGWLLVALVRALIVRAAGRLVSLARWPHGRASAAVLTHDLEPRPYAYTDGLSRLLARRNDTPPAAFGVVATAGRRWLDAEHRDAVGAHPVICHGLDHRGEVVRGRRRVARSLRRARALVERQFCRRIDGYRSPRLDRSPDLDRALDEVGFLYDSSHPDVDRENLGHYGRGVRVNLPYRPLLRTRDGWRSSRCLELPLTAPDCIQPLFAGADAATLAEIVERKAAFVRASGGLHVALVHAGVFGAEDAQRREALLAVVSAQLRHPQTWWAGIDEVVDWWRAREALEVALDGDAVRVVNRGAGTVAGARLVIERADRCELVALPALEPGASSAALAIGAGVERRTSHAA